MVVDLEKLTEPQNHPCLNCFFESGCVIGRVVEDVGVHNALADVISCNPKTQILEIRSVGFPSVPSSISNRSPDEIALIQY